MALFPRNMRGSLFIFLFFLACSIGRDARDTGYVSRVAPLIRLFPSRFVLHARVKRVVFDFVFSVLDVRYEFFVSTWNVNHKIKKNTLLDFAGVEDPVFVI